MTPFARRMAPLLLLVAWLLACGSGDGGAASAIAVSGAALQPSSAHGAASSAEPSATPAPSSSTSAAPAPVAVRSPPVLFEVRGTGKVPPSYLFGTLHLGADAEKVLHPVVFEKLDASAVLVVEVNAFEIDTMAALQLSMLPEGQTIKDKIKPKNWKLLVDEVGGLLMPESSLEKLKPWVLVTLLVAEMLPKTEPMDATIHARAKKANKQIVYLETLTEQVALVERAMDAQVLNDMLEDLPKAQKDLNDLSEAYKLGDLERLTQLSFDPVEMKKHPAMIDLLLYARNQRWVPKLVPLFEKGAVFVAVGAAHLLGEKGVPELLRAKGFQVTRIEGAR